MQTLRNIKKYPIVIGFFALLLLFTCADMLSPDEERSELENRKLEQAPDFTLEALLANEWTMDYGEYIRDQFIARDGWVWLSGLLNAAQGQLEIGGVWLAEDGYQIAKNSTWSTGQENYFPLNTQLVAELAVQYPGKVTTMIVPSPANMLSSKLPYSPQQIDENARLDEMNEQFLAAGANVVDLREAFAVAIAADNQVYYRTDHHWTTDGGAQIAYEEFCKSQGVEAILPSDDLRVEVVDFLGTNYAKTQYVNTVSDTLVYYDLPNAMTYKNPDVDAGEGTKEVTTTIMNKEMLQEYDKYAAFLHGNNGYTVIEGNGEGSVLVLKDSYANSFVPYLVSNYAQVHVVDPRMWTQNIHEVIEQGSFDDILLLYSFASFSEDSYFNRVFR